MPDALPFSLPPPEGGRCDLLVIAGEHSGDEHAARAIRELHGLRPELKVCALGGKNLQVAGAQLLHDLASSSVVGLFEVLKNYSYFRSVFQATVDWIATHQPRTVCLVDYPGFNLRLAKRLRELGVSRKGGGSVEVLGYISPQIWAWKAGRRFEMARTLDALAVIFPFELKSYADTTLPVAFVGHPFLAEDYVSPVRYDAQGGVLLLPGSRGQAVERIFPAMLDGLQLSGVQRAQVLFPSASIRSVLETVLARWRERHAGTLPEVELVGTGKPVAAAMTLTSSGTMSMHCALAGIPGAIVYRANPLTYFIGKRLVKVPYLGIANLILGREMYPEFIQGAASPQALSQQIVSCLDKESAARREKVLRDAAVLRAALKGGSGEQNVAGWLAQKIR